MSESTGATGDPGPRGRRGLRGRKGERGPAEPATTWHLDALSRSFRKVVFIIEGISVVVTVALVITLLGIANQGDQDLSRKINEATADVREDLKKHHYFDSCVFLVLTGTAQEEERTDAQTRDVVFQCEAESIELGQDARVRDVLRENYPDLFK